METQSIDHASKYNDLIPNGKLYSILVSYAEGPIKLDDHYLHLVLSLKLRASEQIMVSKEEGVKVAVAVAIAEWTLAS